MSGSTSSIWRRMNGRQMAVSCGIALIAAGAILVAYR
jgi:hypothetical protein